MGAVQEKFIVEFLDAWGDGNALRPDVDKIADSLAEDAVWQLWMPDGPVLRGRDAIIADIERQLEFATYMKCGLLNMGSTDTTVVTERLDSFQSGDIRVQHSLCAAFDLDADGKISAWREYFDVADVVRQLKAAKVTVPPVAK